MANWQENLASALVALGPEHLTERVRDRLRMVLLHDLAYGLWAVERPAAQAARSLTPAFGEGSHSLFSGGRSGLLGAVFANGTAIAASIQEDAWNGNHLGSALVPTALAVGACKGRTADEVLVALTAGYCAAMAAVQRWGAGSGARGFRGTALYGQLGAAVVAGKLLGLGEGGLSRALSVAANTPGGLPGPLLAGNDEVLLQSGLAAAKGTLAALTAATAITISADGFDARAFFGAGYAGVDPATVEVPPVPDPAEMAQWVLEVGIRAYPLNHLCVAPVAALLRATGGVPMNPGSVTAIQVWMPAAEARGVGAVGPFDRPMQAMFSVPVAMAAALRDGVLPLESLLTGATDAAVLGLASRVVIHPTEGLAPMTAIATMETAGGQLAGEALDSEQLHRPSFDVVAARLRTVGPDLGSERLAVLTEAVGGLSGGADALQRLVQVLANHPVRA